MNLFSTMKDALYNGNIQWMLKALYGALMSIKKLVFKRVKNIVIICRTFVHYNASTVKYKSYALSKIKVPKSFLFIFFSEEPIWAP